MEPARQECLSARTPQLTGARVAVAGLGGLGSHIAIFLARAGVGCLHLIDFDTVDASNLHRQCYRREHVGLHKTEALRREILEIVPACRVVTDTVQVTAANIETLFATDPLVCEAFDNPDAKALLVNTLLERFAHTRVIAASGMAGCGRANSLVTRKITDRLYLCGDGVSAVQPGERLLAPRVAICAGHQALAAIRILLGETAV